MCFCVLFSFLSDFLSLPGIKDQTGISKEKPGDTDSACHYGNSNREFQVNTVGQFQVSRFPISKIVIKPCLMSSALKNIVPCICYCCFRQKSKSSPCYSILARKGSLGPLETLNSRCGHFGEQDKMPCYESINFVSLSVCFIYLPNNGWPSTMGRHYGV